MKEFNSTEYAEAVADHCLKFAKSILPAAIDLELGVVVRVRYPARGLVATIPAFYLVGPEAQKDGDSDATMTLGAVALYQDAINTISHPDAP